MRTVGEVAEVTGVTVRALHHYDEIGLLSPSGRSEAGYRLYSYEDLQRLQEILVWRALGFSLAQTGAMLDEPSYDRGAALRRQRELVERERSRLGAIAHALDAALDAHRNGTRPKEETMFEGFDHAEYADEARRRWGDTDAYRESTRRAAAYGEREWTEIHAQAEAIVQEFVALLRAGEPPGGERARAVAERHRQHISRWFYPCSAQTHRGLGEMYVADQRFKRNYDQQAEGLARFVRDAIVENAGEQAGSAGGLPPRR